jgi:adenylate cyclase
MDFMTKNIMLENGGTVDKFLGDAIMAYWNAPYDIENHRDKALKSAIEQIELLDEINEINMDEKMPLIQIRIGITSGEVFVGEVGGELRSDYTIMGKNVNHAAVLEQAGKYYGASIIISQSVKDNIIEDYTMILLDKIQVDGTSDAFNIYQVFTRGLSDVFTQEYITSFENAIRLYREADIDNAIIIFRNLLHDSNSMNTKLCKIYIKRCEDAYIQLENKNFSYIQSLDKSFISS